MKKKETIVVNIIGGPGVGKSILTSDVFSALKREGISCDIAAEYIKKKLREKALKAVESQIYIFAKQQFQLFTLKDEVDVIVTDSPIFFSAVYDKTKCPLLRALINPKTNEVTLGLEKDLMRQSMIVKKVNTVKFNYDELDGMDVMANVRYRGKTSLAKVTCLGDETVRIDFYHEVKTISAGQSTVFYDPNNINDVIGGGHIYEVLK